MVGKLGKAEGVEEMAVVSMGWVHVWLEGHG
jgi:hypothetical protein